MKDNQQLSRKELYNYDEKLKSDFLELFLNYSKDEVMQKLNISEKDFDILTLILKLRSEDPDISHSKLSRKYNLPYERIRLIRKREVWKHI